MPRRRNDEILFFKKSKHYFNFTNTWVDNTDIKITFYLLFFTHNKLVLSDYVKIEYGDFIILIPKHLFSSSSWEGAYKYVK